MSLFHPTTRRISKYMNEQALLLYLSVSTPKEEIGVRIWTSALTREPN